MAKSSKKSREGEPQEAKSDAPNVESSNGLATGEAAKPVVKKKAMAKSTGRPRSVGTNRNDMARKTPAKRKTHAKTGLQPTPAGHPAVTDEEIRIRAYLISEWRMQNGVSGDSARDWLEARRQLQEESGKRD